VIAKLQSADILAVESRILCGILYFFGVFCIHGVKKSKLYAVHIGVSAARTESGKLFFSILTVQYGGIIFSRKFFF
jgi:hypothetical protein